MKAKEFILEDDINLDELVDAIDSWMEMQAGYNEISIILNHPHSQQFKKIPSVQKLYRTLVPGNKEINQIKSENNFIAYAYRIEGAQEFANTIDVSEYMIVEKDFHPKNFILNFTALYEDLSSSGYIYHSENEYELWMEPTSYYTTYDKSEIVYTS